LTSANATLESGSVASLWAVFHATSVSVTAAGDAHSSVNLTNIPFVYPGTVSQRHLRGPSRLAVLTPPPPR
jgi:hypothetical protein